MFMKFMSVCFACAVIPAIVMFGLVGLVLIGSALIGFGCYAIKQEFFK